MRSGSLSGAALLDLLEPGWRRDLSAGARAATLTVEADLLQAAASALGDQSRTRSPLETAGRWPACVVVAMARIAGVSYRGGSDRGGSDRGGSRWPGWHRAAGVRATRGSAHEWEEAFLAALALLGIGAAGAEQTTTARDAILTQAMPPDPGPQRTADGIGYRRPRLDPFGGGVFFAERPALPEEVADPYDPLLVFDETGECLGRELPAESVWVLYPADADLRSDVPPRVVVSSRLPLTWRGWRLLQVDLRGVCWLELSGGDHDQIARRHLVRGRSGPSLRTGRPVPGVTAITGEPVFASPPAVLLPPGPGQWRVEVRQAGTNAVLNRLTAAGDGWQPERLWEPVTRPVLGELTITVTAADGEAKQGMRRALTVAEGLAARYFPAPRLTTERGLDPAEAVLAAPPGMTVSPLAGPVPAEAVTIEMTCIAAQVLQRLRVTPPHVRIRIEPEPGSSDAPTRWHHAGPLQLRAADLWHGGAFTIDIPGIDRDPPIEVVGEDGNVVQVLEPTRQGRYPLRRMADTVTVHGGASLRITVGGRTATIARIAPPDGAADPWINQAPIRKPRLRSE